MTDSAEAYAALVHIQAGDWDEYALRLYTAVMVRLRTPEVQQRWTSGAIPTQQKGSDPWEPGTA